MKSTIAFCLALASLGASSAESEKADLLGLASATPVAKQAAITDELHFLSNVGKEWKMIADGVYSAYDGAGSNYTVYFGDSGLEAALQERKSELARLELQEHSANAKRSSNAKHSSKLVRESIEHLEALRSDTSSKVTAASTDWVCFATAAFSNFELQFQGTLFKGKITSGLEYYDWGVPGSLGRAYARIEAKDLISGNSKRGYTHNWYGQPISVSLVTSADWDCGMETVQLVRGCGKFYEVKRQASCSTLPEYSEAISQGFWP